MRKTKGINGDEVATVLYPCKRLDPDDDEYLAEGEISIWAFNEEDIDFTGIHIETGSDTAKLTIDEARELIESLQLAIDLSIKKQCSKIKIKKKKGKKGQNAQDKIHAEEI